MSETNWVRYTQRLRKKRPVTDKLGSPIDPLRLAGFRWFQCGDDREVVKTRPASSAIVVDVAMKHQDRPSLTPIKQLETA